MVYKVEVNKVEVPESCTVNIEYHGIFSFEKVSRANHNLT